MNGLKTIIQERIHNELIRLQRLNELSNLDILENKRYLYENYKASINEMSRISV